MAVVASSSHGNPSRITVRTFAPIAEFLTGSSRDCIPWPVSKTRSSRGGLGGIGAIFFLGTLGGIAYYVQRQSVEDERELVRRAVTAVPEPADADKPLALPWEDRLALDAATLIRVETAPLPTVSAEETPEADDEPEDRVPADAPVEPEDGLYVQDLNDGHRILLTLDPVIQESALQIFRNREVPYAAAVMLDLRDNGVLALAGHSSMDPQVDPLEVVATAWGPAASTFKLVTTAALLDQEAANPATKVCFHGGLHGIEDEALSDDPAKDTRCETLSEAIAHSYNLVIGKLALRHLSQDHLAQIARAFQFETDIDFEFNVERSPAHIPSDPIERAKVAAGFWNVDMSPIHGAILASIFARGGRYQPPHIIDQVLGPDGSDLTPALAKTDRVVASDVAMAVGTMMEDTTTVGTAKTSFRDKHGNEYIPNVAVAGKTGSLTGKRPPALNYNWFIGYAPADRPEIAFAVLLANEPKWRIKAHYAARRLVQIYLERREAIARNRDARLTAEGVMLPRRGPGGTLVSAVPVPGAAGSEPSTEGNGLLGALPSPLAEPEPETLPLPPVPGALPTSDEEGS